MLWWSYHLQNKIVAQGQMVFQAILQPIVGHNAHQLTINHWDILSIVIFVILINIMYSTNLLYLC